MGVLVEGGGVMCCVWVASLSLCVSGQAPAQETWTGDRLHKPPLAGLQFYRFAKLHTLQRHKEFVNVTFGMGITIPENSASPSAKIKFFRPF